MGIRHKRGGCFSLINILGIAPSIQTNKGRAMQMGMISGKRKWGGQNRVGLKEVDTKNFNEGSVLVHNGFQ